MSGLPLAGNGTSNRRSRTAPTVTVPRRRARSGGRTGPRGRSGSDRRTGSDPRTRPDGHTRSDGRGSRPPPQSAVGQQSQAVDGGSWQDATGRLITAFQALPSVASAAGLGALLVLSWVVVTASAAEISISRHVYYVPIVLAAIRFAAVGGAGAGLAATILAGPLGPGDPTLATVGSRGLAFVGIGLLVGFLTAATRRAAHREIRFVEAERDLERRRAAIVQTVSHEFRTPLTVIRGVTEFMERYPDQLGPDLQQLVGPLSRAEQRLTSMIAVLLAASDEFTPGSDPEESTDLVVLLEQLSQDLAASPTRDLRTRVDPDAKTVVTRPMHLRLMLRCLLDNAVKFSPEDTPVDVRAVRDDGEVIIEVRDEGVGIDEEFAATAFEAFTQADPSESRRHSGLGVGLFTARQVARRLDGDIDLRPGPEAGAIATIRLPQRRAADASGVPR